VWLVCGVRRLGTGDRVRLEVGRKRCGLGACRGNPKGLNVGYVGGVCWVVIDGGMNSLGGGRVATEGGRRSVWKLGGWGKLGGGSGDVEAGEVESGREWKPRGRLLRVEA